MSDGLAELWRIVASVLSYPIIVTQSRPITVTTLLVAGLILVAAFWVSRRVQGLLQRRLFPRLHLDPGIEFSVLRFAHYAMLGVGVLASAAIDTLESPAGFVHAMGAVASPRGGALPFGVPCYQRVLTSRLACMSRSAVSNVSLCTRAVAAMRRSAGSLEK